MQHETTTLVEGKPAPPVDLIRGASLFLDFDGTLVEIADRPDAVIVDDRLRAVLTALDTALERRLAIVTGRPAAEVERLLGLARLSVSGSHGAEIVWPDGRRREAAPPAWLAPTVSRLEAFSRDRPGVLVEVKPFGVALHYRQAPEAELACQRFAESLTETSDIHLQRGKMVVEFRVPGADKGDAITAFMADRPMIGTRPIVFGDDLTDEAAFAAAKALGGIGVLVGDDRPSEAQYRLAGVPETINWLEAAARVAA
ncbi:trehalose-phosphatase [Sphingomonas natans]|nr:trehalose-phosphatase [Sphingomonas sp. BIUV-7]